jgi:zinc D-Ala-D-Ala carboxypeptidase
MNKAVQGYLLAALAAFFLLRPRAAAAAFIPPDNFNGPSDQAERTPTLFYEAVPYDVIFDQIEDANFMTPNFTIEEFTASATAINKNIDNALPNNLLDAAQNTLDMMQRIRNFLSAKAGRDIPILIQSGYRSPELNILVGGTSNSDHTYAAAVDFRAPAFGSAYDVALALSTELETLGIGQLINEYPDGQGWVHVSTNSPLKDINKIITVARSGTKVGITRA